ncbi:MAG: D-alanine--D-alanine ligase [Thermoanaerobaculia bacterium]|nr:D-alanine--D-alanine ligase [Thermoanaerobaculia bacterium]
MHRIALLTGGSTPERDVALAGAAQVVKALRTLGHEVTVVDTVSGPLTLAAEEALLAQDVRREPPTPERLAELAAQENLPALVSSGEMRAADLVFLVLHGLQGEGGTVQALLELGRLRYTGSGPLGSGMAMDKEVTKRQLQAAGIPTADWGMWPMLPGAIADLGLPLIVKPSNGGSTVGLTLVKAPEEVDDAVGLALETDRDVMLERFLPGREFTVGILGQQALSVGEIIPQHEIFDYECKYTPGLTREVFPAEIPDELAREMRDLALATHRVLKLRDFSRVDFRLDAAGAPYVLEANTLPGMTGTSLLPQSAAAVGIPFLDLCAEICRLALAR